MLIVLVPAILKPEVLKKNDFYCLIPFVSHGYEYVPFFLYCRDAAKLSSKMMYFNLSLYPVVLWFKID